MRINSSIKTWAEDDRPREKLSLKGKAALSDAELLAIVLGSGSRSQTAVELAQEILRFAQNDLALFSKFSLEDLKKFKGIGEAKAIGVIAALELGRRRKEIESRQELKSHQPKWFMITCDPIYWIYNTKNFMLYF